ncbi:MAG: H-X9-DG-CTERM domain-containing protein, partial [Pirellulales bacterium]
GSAHSGTWNAAFGDGSVRSISYDIDLGVHKNLAAKAPRYAGEVLPAF